MVSSRLVWAQFAHQRFKRIRIRSAQLRGFARAQFIASRSTARRQTRKLAISQINLRRTETVLRIRAEINDLLLQAENAERKRAQMQTLFDAQSSLVAVLEVGYKSGELSTERMLPVWEKLRFYKIEIQNAETERETIKKKLIVLVEFQPIVEMTRENARTQIIEDVEKVWKLSGTTEKLNLIVLDADEKRRVFKSELMKIFQKA